MRRRGQACVVAANPPDPALRSSPSRQKLQLHVVQKVGPGILPQQFAKVTGHIVDFGR